MSSNEGDALCRANAALKALDALLAQDCESRHGLELRIAGLQSELAALQGTVEQAEAHARRAAEERDAFAAALAARADQSELVETLGAKAAALEARVASLESQLADSTRKIDEAQRATDSERSLRTKAEAALAAERRRAEELAAKVGAVEATARIEQARSAARIAELEAALDKMRATCEAEVRRATEAAASEAAVADALRAQLASSPTSTAAAVARQMSVAQEPKRRHQQPQQPQRRLNTALDFFSTTRR